MHAATVPAGLLLDLHKHLALSCLTLPAHAAVPPGLLPPRQAAELLEVMGDKGVRMRTDVMEAVMQALDEQPLLL